MRYAATVESLIAIGDNPKDFVFEIGPILHIVNTNGRETYFLTFGDKNFHKTFLPLLANKTASSFAKQLVHKPAYKAMVAEVAKTDNRFTGVRMASIEDAIAYAKDHGWAEEDVFKINASIKY